MLASFYQDMGQPGRAADVVRKWLSLHPRDRSAAQLLEQLEGQAGGQGP
jgi:hypothetical protein